MEQLGLLTKSQLILLMELSNKPYWVPDRAIYQDVDKSYLIALGLASHNAISSKYSITENGEKLVDSILGLTNSLQLINWKG